MKKKLEKFSREWFVEQGKIGGLKTKRLYGEMYYKKHLPKTRYQKVDNSKKAVETPIKQGA